MEPDARDRRRPAGDPRRRGLPGLQASRRLAREVRRRLLAEEELAGHERRPQAAATRSLGRCHGVLLRCWWRLRYSCCRCGGGAHARTDGGPANRRCQPVKQRQDLLGCATACRAGPLGKSQHASNAVSGLTGGGAHGPEVARSGTATDEASAVAALCIGRSTTKGGRLATAPASRETKQQRNPRHATKRRCSLREERQHSP